MMWGYAGFGMMIWMVLFWVGIALLVAWAIRGRDGAAVTNRAVEILEERFAHGEIDSDEFETRRKQLSR